MTEKTILLVDDEADIIQTLIPHLVVNGYGVISAVDGVEGLKKARSERPDLIILDVVMPNMDGYTFIKELRSDQDISSIPVIVITVRDKMKDLFEVEGVKDYVTKPFEVEDLIEKVNKYFNV